jgi:hypothetical protein
MSKSSWWMARNMRRGTSARAKLPDCYVGVFRRTIRGFFPEMKLVTMVR